MILIFCFNNLFEVLKKVFWCSLGYDKYLIKVDISNAPANQQINRQKQQTHLHCRINKS